MGTIPHSALPLAGAPSSGENGTGNATAVLMHDTHARFWLAMAIIGQFVLLVGYVSVKGANLPDSQLILGAEISFVTMVLNYFFGSSSGSVTKSASSMDEQALEDLKK